MTSAYKKCVLYPDRVVTLESKEDYPEDVEGLFNLMSVGGKGNVRPVGSFSSKDHPYPGDIDLMEDVLMDMPYGEARHKLSAMFTTLGREIIRAMKEDRGDVYFTDCKAGYDERFDIYTGTLTQDGYEDYYPDDVRSDLLNLREQRVLEGEAFDALYRTVLQVPTLEQYNAMREAIRSYYILRWSLDELSRGYKILPGRKTYNLGDALTDGSVVKVDIAAWLHGRYVEVTDWYLLMREDCSRRVKTLSAELGDYVMNVSLDVLAYEDSNTMKAGKRLWALSRWVGDDALSRRLGSLFQSYASLLYQINADIETLKLLYEKGYSLDRPRVREEIRGFIGRMEAYKSRDESCVPEDKERELYAIFSSLGTNVTTGSPEFMALLDRASAIILDTTNTYTQGYFRTHDIHPTEYVLDLARKEGFTICR